MIDNCIIIIWILVKYTLKCSIFSVIYESVKVIIIINVQIMDLAKYFWINVRFYMVSSMWRSSTLSQ